MLHFEAIEPETLELLRSIQKRPFMSQTRLVGGTALALHLGHRISVDLDFFGTWHPLDALEDELSQCGCLVRHDSTARLQFFEVNGVKVDCVTYEYPWLEEPVSSEGVRIAGLKDIAALKINAITNRGTRKDFVDFAFLLGSFQFSDLFNWYLKKYGNVNPALALRSLVYFCDAEDMPMPRMLVPFDWEGAKDRIVKSVRAFVVNHQVDR